MKSFVTATATLSLACLLGCGKSDSTSDNKSSEAKSPNGSTVAKSQSIPVKTKKPPLDQRVYGEHRLATWPRVIKNLDPNGPDGAAAVKGLTALIADEDVPIVVRTQAAVTLGRIGKPAAPSVSLFASQLQRPFVKEDAAGIAVTMYSLKALELMGPTAKSATPELIAIVKDSNRPILQRAGALEVLSRIGTADARAVETVIAMLRLRREFGVELHDYWMLRGAAADGVAMIGPEAFVAIPDLIRCLRMNNRSLRRKSAIALGTMGDKGRDAIVPLAELMVEDNSPAIRDAAADALASLGPLAVPVLRRLVRSEDESADVKAQAAKSLGKIGKAASEAVDDLDFSLDDDDPWVRLHAAEAIFRITDNPRSLVSMSTEEIVNPNRQVRMQAYRFFKELGPKAKNAELGLNRLLSNKSLRYKTEIRKALQAIKQPR